MYAPGSSSSSSLEQPTNAGISISKQRIKENTLFIIIGGTSSGKKLFATKGNFTHSIITFFDNKINGKTIKILSFVCLHNNCYCLLCDLSIERKIYAKIYFF